MTKSIASSSAAMTSRREPGDAGAGDLVPAPLIAVALDRREPVVLDGELGHGPLDAEDAAKAGDLPDVGGNAAGQPLCLDAGNIGNEAEASGGSRESPAAAPIRYRSMNSWASRGGHLCRIEN